MWDSRTKDRFFHYLIPSFIIELNALVAVLHLIIFLFLNHQFNIPQWNFCVFTWKKSFFSIDFSNDLERKSSKMTLHFFVLLKCAYHKTFTCLITSFSEYKKYEKNPSLRINYRNHSFSSMKCSLSHLLNIFSIQSIQN